MITGRDDGPELSAEALRRVCDFLYRRTGMSYGEAKRYYIERRVTDRMQRAGTPNFPTYMLRLEADDDEAEALINSFTVNETYFYREDHQLACLSNSLLPEIVAGRGPGDLVRIWSVPCSTGEEPYSVAIWLLENWAMVDAYNIEIVGSDIDTIALAAAELGQFGARALSRLPAEVLARYFDAATGDTKRIIRDLRESVQFTPVNLVDRSSVTRQGRFDVVFCRNVLIYFDEASRLEAANNLFGAMAPGGFICLGHTESMSRISPRFEMRRFADAIVYQRAAT
jgi:chemotaxis protein methyltransferase CheR